MMIEVLQAKLQRAVVTDSNVKYRGSITLDRDIMDDLGIRPYQRCDINLVGEDEYGQPFRGNSYILPGPRGTGCCEANGALSYHIPSKSEVHLNFYASVPEESIKDDYEPIVIESNKPYIK